MNRIYKIIWSKVKNCYIVVSELAKNYTKVSNHHFVSRKITAGILLSLLSSGFTVSAFAEDPINITSNDNTRPNTVTSNSTVVVGKNNVLTGDEIIVFGSDNIVQGSNITPNNVVILGNHNSVAYSNNPNIYESVIIGSNSKSAEGSIAIGEKVNIDINNFSDTKLIGKYALALGYGAYTEGESSIALGLDSYAKEIESIAIGDSAYANGMTSIAIGKEANTSADHNIAIGYGANTTDEGTIAIGYSAMGQGVEAVALGRYSYAVDNSIAIGSSAGAESENTIAIGNGAWTSQNNAMAIGHASDALALGSTALGYASSARGANSVAVGANSKATAENVVSFGDSSTNLTRRLINVSDGIDDTDVPTMKQLNKVAATKVLAGNNVFVAESTDANGIKQYTVSAVVDSSNLEINGDGLIQQNNVGLVSGNTVYNEVRVPSNGQYIKSANTASENLSALDTQLYNTQNRTKFFGNNSYITNYDLGFLNIDELASLRFTGIYQDKIDLYYAKYSNIDGIGAVGVNSMAIGNVAYAEGDDSIVIGNNASSQISKDKNGNYVRGYSLAMLNGEGLDSEGKVNYSYDSSYAVNTGQNNVVIGNDASSRTNNSVAIGHGAYTETYFDSNEVHYFGDESVAIGGNAQTINSYATAIGGNSSTSYKGTVIGAHASATEGSVAIGFSSWGRSYPKVTGNHVDETTISIGYDTTASLMNNYENGYSPIAIGHMASANEALAIGDTANAVDGSIVLGHNSSSTYTTTVNKAKAATLDKNIVIGNNSKFGYTSGTAGNVLLGQHTFSQGNRSNSVAIGNNSTITQDNVVSFGHKANESSETEYVYNSELKRRLVNVADGTLSSDAATVGQIEKVLAGNNVSIITGTASNGATSRTVNVISNGQIAKGETAIVTGGTVYEAYKNTLHRNQITAGNNVVVTNTDLPPTTINDIVSPYNSGTDKTNALNQALTTYGNIINGDPLVVMGVTNTEMNDFMGSLYNGTLYGSMTQERFDEIMGKTLQLQEDTFGSKQISVMSDGTVASNDTKLVTGGTVFDEVRVDEDGNYIKADKTTAENLKALDNAVKNAESNSGSDELAVKYDSNTKDIVTLAGANRTKITNVIAGTISENSTDAVNGSQLYATNQKIGTLSENGNYILRDNNVSQNLAVLDTNLKQTANKARFIGIKASINLANSDGFYSYYNEIYGPSDYASRLAKWQELNNADGSGAEGENATAIGNTAHAEGDFSIAFGPFSRVAVLKDSNGNEIKGTSLGGVKINGQPEDSSFSLPAYQHKTGKGSIAIGNQAYTYAEGSIAIGSETNVGDYNGDYRHFMTAGTAVGNYSYVYNSYGTSIGAETSAAYKGTSLGFSAGSGTGGIAIGYDAYSRQDNMNASNNGAGIAIGYESFANYGFNNITDYAGIALGNHASAAPGIAIGTNTNANLDNVVIGHNSIAKYTSGTGGNAILGSHSFVSPTVSNSVALGKDSTATASNVVSFGHKANESVANSDYSYTSDLTRRLVNVSDGTSATDAATVRQLDKVLAGNNVYITSTTASNGSTNKTINVNSNGQIAKGNSTIVTGGTVYEAYKNVLNRNQISAGNNVVVTDTETLPVTVSDIVNSYSTGSEKTSALSQALTTYGNIINGDPLVVMGVTSSEMNDFMGTLYNGTLYGSISQARFDEIMTKTLQLQEDSFGSKQISVISNGAVASNDTKLITGDTVYNEVRVDEDGNYIKADNTTAQNLKALDNAVKNAGGGSSINEDLIVKYDSESKDTVTLAGTNGTKLTNLKPATLSANSTDAVIGAQLYATNANIEGFATDINRNKTNIASLNTSVTAALGSVSATSTLVTTLNDIKADASLNNLTNTGKQVIATAAMNAVQEYMASQQGNNVNNPIAPTAYNPNTLSVTNAGNGSLFVGEGSNVNGSSSIAIGVGNQVNANNSGAFGDPSVINADESYVLGNDDTINTGATGSFIVGNNSISSAKGGLSFGSNNVLEDTADNSIALGNNVNVTGKNSIALGSNSTAIEDNIVSVGNDTLKRKITNVLDGNISQESTDVITGSQLYATNQKVQENTDAIVTKADLDASNINVPQWAEKLGIGHIAEGDSNLVSGDTVFKAFKDIDTTSDLISYNGITNQIGIGNNTKYDFVDTINISNSNGDGRVITGVVTNPKDASSAVNMGYLTGVADNIINNINEGFTETNSRINRVGANAAALASLEPVPTEWDEKWNLSVAVGNFRNETAAALGAFYKPTSNTMINVKGTVGNKENMVGAGMSIALTKGGNNGPTKLALMNKVNTLERRNDELENTVRTMSEKLDALTMLLEKSNVLSNTQK